MFAVTESTFSTLDLASLILRVGFGLSMVVHGYNKVFGSGGLAGTAGWFGSIGMKYPTLQARAAAGTEIFGGLALAVGFLTPLASAAMVGLMIVAGYVAHWKSGYLITKGGWEYNGAIIVAALATGTLGGGQASIDNALGIFESSAFAGFWIALGVGVIGGIGQLVLFYRPKKS